jgi:large subunit ribosomal protein L18
MIKKENKNELRQVRHLRVRKKVSGTSTTPRLTIYRSLSGIYAQLIDDEKGVTLLSASTVDKDLTSKKIFEGKSKKEQARIIGKEIAKRALKKNIKTVVFDRGGYLYTGRVQALAEGAREAGLEF